MDSDESKETIKHGGNWKGGITATKEYYNEKQKGYREKKKLEFITQVAQHSEFVSECNISLQTNGKCSIKFESVKEFLEFLTKFKNETLDNYN